MYHRQAAGYLGTDVRDDLLPLCPGFVVASGQHARELRTFTETVEIQPVHEFGHGHRNTVDHVSVQHTPHARVVDAGQAPGRLDEGVVQVDLAATRPAQALHREDAVEPGQPTHACPEGFDTVFPTQALLKLVATELPRPRRVGNDGQPGCLCHRC
jgi:hypothetical protein